MKISSIVPMPSLQDPKPGTHDVHVVPSFRGWAVTVENSSFYYSFANTQIEAIAQGMQLARQAAASLLIHGRDGRIRDVWHYG